MKEIAFVDKIEKHSISLKCNSETLNNFAIEEKDWSDWYRITNHLRRYLIRLLISRIVESFTRYDIVT